MASGPSPRSWGPLWRIRISGALLDHNGVRYPVEEYLTHLRAFGDEAVFDEMVHELYAVMAIERSKFDRVIRCRRWAVACFVAWVAPFLMITYL